MAGKYAKTTSVPWERSRAEIEATLSKYGATSFGYGWQPGTAVIQFEFESRRMRFTLPLPIKRAGERWSDTDKREKEERRRWRALFLSIKAKLVTVDEGISTVEIEFMGHIVLPGNQTVAEWLEPQIEAAYQSGEMPKLLEGPK